MIKVYIQPRHDGSLINDIHIVDMPERFAPGNIYRHLSFNEKGEGVARAVEHTSGAAVSTSPAMILDEQETRELIVAFAQLAKDRGMTLPDESFAKGKLEATERHLSDMREIALNKNGKKK